MGRYPDKVVPFVPTHPVDDAGNEMDEHAAKREYEIRLAVYRHNETAIYAGVMALYQVVQRRLYLFKYANAKEFLASEVGISKNHFHRLMRAYLLREQTRINNVKIGNKCTESVLSLPSLTSPYVWEEIAKASQTVRDEVIRRVAEVPGRITTREVKAIVKELDPPPPPKPNTDMSRLEAVLKLVEKALIEADELPAFVWASNIRTILSELRSDIVQRVKGGCEKGAYR
jgi:hypothetical protein